MPNFFRYFYSETLDKARADAMTVWNNEQVFSTQIFDHNTENQIDLFFTQNTVVCITHPLNGTVPTPNFTNFMYVGKALINYLPAYQWIDSIAGEYTLQYWSDQSTSEPLRFDFSDLRRGFFQSFVFYEFDETAQDPSLYLIPSTIAPLCNYVNETGPSRFFF